MKKMKIFIAAAVFMSLVMILSGCGVSEFVLDNTDEGTVEIIALNSEAGSGGLGYVTVEEGEKLHVKAELTNKSSIIMEVLSAEELSDADYVNGAEEAEVLLEESFSGKNEYEFEIPEGDYVLRISTTAKSTGTVSIYGE